MPTFKTLNMLLADDLAVPLPMIELKSDFSNVAKASLARHSAMAPKLAFKA